jgi:hypothetical protein
LRYVNGDGYIVSGAIHHMTGFGFRVESALGNSATFVRDRHPSCLVALVLLCLGIIPGLLYLLLAGGPVSRGNHLITRPG